MLTDIFRNIPIASEGRLGVRQQSSDPYTQVVQISSALKGRDSKAQGVSPGLGHGNK